MKTKKVDVKLGRSSYAFLVPETVQPGDRVEVHVPYYLQEYLGCTQVGVVEGDSQYTGDCNAIIRVIS